jgi:hypothetical protein
VEIIVFPLLPVETKKDNIKPEQFFGVSRLEHVDQLHETLRDEWEH